MRIREKLAWVMLAALGLFVVAAMAGVATSGPLDPPGPVASTMKTLEEIPGSWSRSLSTDGADPCNTDRFRCVLNDEAVLDLETGLVWRRSLFGTTSVPWAEANDACLALTIGGVFGWRLPSADEASTLVLPAIGYPDGHPFEFAGGPVWTSTTSAVDDARAFAVNTTTGAVADGLKTSIARPLCVRGPA